MMTFACGVCSRRLLHAAAVMAGLGCASISAWADSAQGVDTLLGSGLNPDGLDPTVPAGKSAAGSFRPGGSHTPTGTRYLSPPEYPEPVLGANGWAYNASLEAGFWGLNGNEANALFRQYRVLLQQAYGDFVHSNAATEKVFKVFQDTGGRQHVPLASLRETLAERRQVA